MATRWPWPPNQPRLHHPAQPQGRGLGRVLAARRLAPSPTALMLKAFPLAALTLTAVTLPVLPMTGAWARPPSPGEGGAVLQQFKRLELQKLEEAMALMRSSQRCVIQAGTLQSLHECHRLEREADWQQRERFHARIEALRLQYGLDRHGGQPFPPRGGLGRPPFGGGRLPPGGFP